MDRELEDSDAFTLTEDQHLDRLWEANELTLAGVIYAAVVAITGVVVAVQFPGASWWWAGGMIFLGVLAAWRKNEVIAVMDSYLNWVGPRWPQK
jgi:hypothetical protein